MSIDPHVTDTRTMNIVHNALRRDLTRAQRALASTPPPNDERRTALADHLDWMMHFLHVHHDGEDRGLWPMVRRLNPDAGPLLDRMDADHRLVAPEITGVTAAVAAYRSNAVSREELSQSLGRLTEVLIPHLQLEENEAMPVVARTLSQTQLDEWEERFYLAPKSKQELGLEAHWLIDGADRQDYDIMAHKVGPFTRFMLLHAFARPYRRACAARWGAGVDIRPLHRRPARTEGSVDVHIDAPARSVYEVLSDVTRTGERSTECVSCTPLPGKAAGDVGARFRGRNRSGHLHWSRLCEVTAADPGKAFAFRTVPARHNPAYHDSTLWSYRLTPDGTGTRVQHSYRVIEKPYRPFEWGYLHLLPQHHDMRPQMRDNLEALRRQLESATPGPTVPATTSSRRRTAPASSPMPSSADLGDRPG